MHDLTAKKLKHTQAIHKPKYVERTRHQNRSIYVLAIVCAILIILMVYGV